MRRRAVIIRRPTEYDELMDCYSTRGQGCQVGLVCSFDGFEAAPA